MTVIKQTNLENSEKEVGRSLISAWEELIELI